MTERTYTKAEIKDYVERRIKLWKDEKQALLDAGLKQQDMLVQRMEAKLLELDDMVVVLGLNR